MVAQAKGDRVGARRQLAQSRGLRPWWAVSVPGRHHPQQQDLRVHFRLPKAWAEDPRRWHHSGFNQTLKRGRSLSSAQMRAGTTLIAVDTTGLEEGCHTSPRSKSHARSTRCTKCHPDSKPTIATHVSLCYKTRLIFVCPYLHRLFSRERGDHPPREPEHHQPLKDTHRDGHIQCSLLCLGSAIEFVRRRVANSLDEIDRRRHRIPRQHSKVHGSIRRHDVRQQGEAHADKFVAAERRQLEEGVAWHVHQPQRGVHEKDLERDPPNRLAEKSANQLGRPHPRGPECDSNGENICQKRHHWDVEIRGVDVVLWWQRLAVLFYTHPRIRAATRVHRQ
eukprot:m.190202 g.190202  ORF g.190202 m.190202 type:complete len:335 (-) comp24880_c0_seq1:525-1529(-)